jgi:DNA polymerase III epsilon subunit-like protein
MFKIIDIETTSLRIAEAEILTMCCITLDENLNQVSMHDWKIRPRIWRESYEPAIKIHGISREESAEYPKWDSVIDSINLVLLEGADNNFVCHARESSKLAFDYACLKYMMLDQSKLFEFYKALPERNIFSTHTMAKHLGIQGKLNLRDLNKTLGFEDFKHHDVKEDTISCRNIFTKLFKTINIKEYRNKVY